MSDRLQLIRESTDKMAGHSSLEDAYSDRAWLLNEYDKLASRLDYANKTVELLNKTIDSLGEQRDTFESRLGECRESNARAVAALNAATSRLSSIFEIAENAWGTTGETEALKRIRELGRVVERRAHNSTPEQWLPSASDQEDWSEQRDSHDADE